jgi:HAMP domain-containing protein
VKRRLLVGPRSIRGKLVLALMIAVVPSLFPQVYHWIVLLAEGGDGSERGLRVETSVAQSVAAVLIGIAVVFVTGNRLGHLMRRLIHAAAAIAVGDYRKRVHIRTGDELEVLGETFNVLGESLEERDAAIRKQAEMIAGMAEAARVASSTLDLKACGRAVAKVTCTHLGARDAAVYVRDAVHGGPKLIGYCGRRPRSVWKLVAQRATDSGDYLLISERPAAEAEAEQSGNAMLTGIPLALASGCVGAIVARFQGGITRSDLTLGGVRADVLSAFGVHAAAAIANAEAYSESARYSQTLENWIEELSVVMRVADAISPSLTLDETLAALARETVSALEVDLCVILIPDRRGALVVKGSSASEDESVREMRLSTTDTETGRAFSEKRTVACRDLSRSRFRESREQSRAIGMRSLLTTALVVEERSIGALSVYSRRPRTFTPREVRLLTSIGLHTAVTVRNAGLYTRESSIAEALQSNLVSEAPEECRGLRFASRYMPAFDEARVGGDFFEVVALPNGKVGVVIADVSGKGLRAAIHLAACKYMMKPLMFAEPDDPAHVMSELNSAINYYFDSSFFVTVFYGVADPEEGVIEYANAGHVPALLIAEGGRIHSALSSTGIPVGSGYGCTYGCGRVRISPTDTLLLYTDGVIESRTENGLLGVEGLHQMVFEAGRCTVRELVNHIAGRLSDRLRARQNDDIALLAVSFEGVKAGRRTIAGGTLEHEYRLPSEPS